MIHGFLKKTNRNPTPNQELSYGTWFIRKSVIVNIYTAIIRSRSAEWLAGTVA